MRSTGTAKRSRSSRFGVRSGTARSYPSAAWGVKPLRMRADVLVCRAEVLGGVHRQPDPVVTERSQTAARRQRREGGRLVVAPLRELRERLLAEDVEPAADPVRQHAGLVEARDEVAVA